MSQAGTDHEERDDRCRQDEISIKNAEAAVARSGIAVRDTMFLHEGGKRKVMHWRRLEGFEHRVPAVVQQLPAAPVRVHAYPGYLYTIGEHALRAAFVQVRAMLARADVAACLGYRNVAFYVDSRLAQFVYGQPHRLKREPRLRSATLAMLDALVDAGSSSAYRMQDDFVTPSRPMHSP